MRPKTIFCDIDGTLVEHATPYHASQPTHNLNIIDGTIEKLLEWDRLGYNIILTTGRKESLRTQTTDQLSRAGIFYDKLIMGIGGGERVLINDLKPNSDRETATAICLKRNEGIKNVKL